MPQRTMAVDMAPARVAAVRPGPCTGSGELAAGPVGQEGDASGGDQGVARAGHPRDRRVQQHEAHGLPGRGGGLQLGAVALDDLLELGDRGRQVGRAEPRGRHVGLLDEEIGLGGVQGLAAVGLERLQERPDLGDVHPAQQVRVVSGVRPAELILAAHPPVHRPHVRDGVLGVGHGAERGDREVVAGALQASPRDHPCSRCGRRPRPSRKGATTAAAAPRSLRGTSPRPGSPARSGRRR